MPGPASARPPLPPGPFLVCGLARSGEGVALALAASGERVIGIDAGRAENPALSAAAQRLRGAGVEVHLDARDDGLQHGARTLVKSPGVPQSAPPVAAARKHGIPVVGELEIAWRLLRNDFIAVTGTNGKTTTTEWIGHIHREAGAPVAVAGNVGTALSTLIGQLDQTATVVCECSSFQLEDTQQFEPDTAVLLNITPDHLDRHGTFAAYVEAKLLEFANQTAGDFAVFPDDLEFIPGGEATRVLIGTSDRAALRCTDAVLRWQGAPLIPLEEIRLPGEHNLQNAMAAAAACLSRGIDADAVVQGLATFAGVQHRLELVAKIRGIGFVNDSKATNVASTVVALNASARGVHLILGGQGKAQDFSPLAELVAERCTAAYLIGEDAELIAAAIEPALNDAGKRCERVGDLDHAVSLAATRAQPGEVVLLSPACASFDQFANFEARGDHFRDLVTRMKA